MGELIKVQNENGKQTVNARDLHEFLEVGKDFSNWIKDRVEQFGFAENQDFIVFAESGEKGRPRQDYHLTLDMAKELSMVERNDKGKQARLYFIECERRAQDPSAILNDPAAMRGLLLTYSEKVLQLQPKADAFDRLNGAESLMSIRNAAKALKKKEHDFVKWLQINGWIFRNKKGRLEGYSSKVPRYVDHKVTPIPVDGDEDRVSLQVMITAEGLTKLATLLNVEIEKAA